jgi:hypothetical protein
MIVIKQINDFNTKIVYSSSKSRPSKSLLTPELYKQKEITTPFDIYENLIEHQVKEVTEYYKRGTNNCMEKFILSTNFSKIINFINENKCSLFYKLDNLHSYVNIEFIMLTSSLFKKTTVYFSKFDYAVFIFCENKLDKNINILIENDKYVKSFGIIVPEELQFQIKTINDSIFKNEIRIKTRLINNLTLQKRELIIKDIDLSTKYYLSYIKHNDITNNSCRCSCIFKSEILDCRVCEKCYSLYSEDSFLSDLDLDHAAAASENAFL